MSSSLRSWCIPALLSVLAFAANSIFCRLALISGEIDAASFTVIRLFSGGVFLWLLLQLRSPKAQIGGNWRGGFALFIYAYLFSVAYVELDAGIGALLLFGAVQITMFVGAWLGGEKLRARAVLGMVLAFTGLISLLLPSAHAPKLSSTLWMLLSGTAWGLYSLWGKGAKDPLAATTGNFIRSLPLLLVLLAVIALNGNATPQWSGIGYALASGIFASGAGYAVWYSVVTQLCAQQAATLQLSVPVLAAIGGVLFLGEALTIHLILAAALVLCGVAYALTGKPSPNGS